MKTNILTLLFLSLCSIGGPIKVDAHPRSPKVYYNSIHTPPLPPIKSGKQITVPKIFNPVGHVYGLSIHGYKIMFNFCPNGRVYREGDSIGSPFTIHGNIITVYSNHGPERIIGMGKISRDGRNIEWREFFNGAKYRLRLIG